MSGQDYRIYVDVNYDGGVPNEIYPPENPDKQYAPGLPLGLDPGQNDERWGYATVMAPSAQQAATSQPPNLRFGAVPLAIVNNSGALLTQNLLAHAGTPLELRADICASSSSGAPQDLLVFDGDPSNGNLIAWKRFYVPNPQQCEGTWFSWTPTSGQHQTGGCDSTECSTTDCTQ